MVYGLPLVIREVSSNKVQEYHRMGQNKYSVYARKGTGLKEVIEPVYLAKIIPKPVWCACPYQCTNLV